MHAGTAMIFFIEWFKSRQLAVQAKVGPAIGIVPYCALIYLAGVMQVFVNIKKHAVFVKAKNIASLRSKPLGSSEPTDTVAVLNL